MLYPQLMRGAGHKPPGITKLFMDHGGSPTPYRVGIIETDDPSNLAEVTTTNVGDRWRSFAADPNRGLLFGGTIFGDVFVCLDISDPSNITELSRLGADATRFSEDVQIFVEPQNERVLVTNGAGNRLSVIDYSDPANIAYLDSGVITLTGATAPLIYDAGNQVLYSIGFDTKAFDCSANTTAPELDTFTRTRVSSGRSMDENGIFYGVNTSGTDDDLLAHDGSVPTALTYEGFINLYVAGEFENCRDAVPIPGTDYIAVGGDSGALQIVNKSTPSAMTKVQRINANSGAGYPDLLWMLYDQNDRVLYGGDESKVMSFDMSDPTAPAVLDYLDTATLSAMTRPCSNLPGPSSYRSYGV